MRRCFFLVIFFLGFGLAGVEVPELVDLCDDTSNDFELVEPNRNVVASPEKARGKSELTHDRFYAAEEFQSLSFLPRPDPLAIPGKDLLPLLSIQRK